MSLRTKYAFAVAVLVAVVAAGAAIGNAGSVSITTPKNGSSVALHSNPYTAVAGTVAFAAANPQTTRFYLRRDGCGTSSDNPHLSIASGTDAGDGCGLIVNSVVGLEVTSTRQRLSTSPPLTARRSRSTPADPSRASSTSPEPRQASPRWT